FVCILKDDFCTPKTSSTICCFHFFSLLIRDSSSQSPLKNMFSLNNQILFLTVTNGIRKTALQSIRTVFPLFIQSKKTYLNFFCRFRLFLDDTFHGFTASIFGRISLTHQFHY